MRRARRAMCALAAAMLIVPASAQAATEFGANLSQSAVDGFINGINHTHTHTGAAAETTGSPVAGILTRVQLNYRGDGGTGRFVILSRPANNANFRNEGELSFDVPATQNSATFSFGVRRAIAVGHRLGVGSTSTFGGLIPGTSEAVDKFRGGSGAARFWGGQDHPPGTTGTYSSPAGAQEVLVRGTVEPDGDGDGFGDESQDGCQGTAGPSGGCPQPSASASPGTLVPGLPLPVSNKFTVGTVKGSFLEIRVPGPGTVAVADGGVTTRSTARRKRKKKKKIALIRRSQVRAKAAGLVKVPLHKTRTGRARLRRRGKLGVRVRVTYTPTGGRAASQVKKVTVKLKKRKKRRRRR